MRAAKQKTEARQEQIAQAALQLLARNGLNGVSVTDVAQVVGVVPSAIYRHFKGKDDVLDTVLDLIRDRLLGIVHVVCEQTPRALDRLDRLHARHIEFIRRNPGIPSLVFSADAYAGHDARRARTLGTVRAYLAAVKGIVAAGQQAGEIRKAVDPEAAAMLFLGTIQPSAFLWHLSGGRSAFVANADKAWQVVRAAFAVG